MTLEESEYKMVIVAKEDVDRSHSLEGDTCSYCGVCALKAIQSDLMNPNVAKVEIQPIERMTEEEAKSKNVMFYHDDRCMEWGCGKPADYLVTVWL